MDCFTDAAPPPLDLTQGFALEKGAGGLGDAAPGGPQVCIHEG